MRSTRRALRRRAFLKSSLAAGALAGAVPAEARGASAEAAVGADAPPLRAAGQPYDESRLDSLALPLGGMGAGMICLEGAGGLTHVSIRHRPELDHQPGLFAAIAIRSPEKIARVLEGPAAKWKLYRRPHAAKGDARIGLGLPRFETASFRARFPFGHVELQDPSVPLAVTITGWSPFEPGDADDASLPVAGVEYTFASRSTTPVEAVFSYHLQNFLAPREAPRQISGTVGGVVLYGGPHGEPKQPEAWFAVATDDPAVKVNHAWFRGGWFDPQTMAWRDVEAGAAYDRPVPAEGEAPPGATLFVPFSVAPGASKTVRLRFAWFCPATSLHAGPVPEGVVSPFYRPWYAARFAAVEELVAYWREHYDELRTRTERFSRCFFDSTLPPEAVEAVAANLSILKSPTVMRQADGRLWGWEGCDEEQALGHGTCTHVWNYAQAVAHLFPALERGLRETEFSFGQDARGHQNFRVPLPIQATTHDFHAAADGQLGGILKTHREWRISGDTEWLRRWWPKVKASLDYCIETWDPNRSGWLEEPHHNTYDIEFWGPDGMCTSFYLGALAAAVAMGRALGEDVTPYDELLSRGTKRADAELFNGEYYVQKVVWKGLRAKSPAEAQSYGGAYSPEARALLEQEGPKYQYGAGCLSDGVLGSWLALAAGVGQVLDADRVRSHLRAVHRHNLKKDLFTHVNPQRPTYANGHEGGLLLCSWPRGEKPALPFVYSDEVWTGIEYQAAAHMIQMGLVAEGLEVVRACRARYDGRVRNPFDEYEWGHWYARAMASYALLGALSGARYDAVDKVLHLEPRVAGDFRSFLATASGYGTVGVANGKPFLDVRSGTIAVAEIRYTPRDGSPQ